MFIWTAGDVVTTLLLACCVLVFVAVVLIDIGGRQVSRLITPRPGRAWKDRSGDVYVIEAVEGGVIKVSETKGIHR